MNKEEKIDILYKWLNENDCLPQWENKAGKRKDFPFVVDSNTISGTFLWDGSAPWPDLSTKWQTFCSEGGLND